MPFRVKNDDLSLKCEFRDKNVNQVSYQGIDMTKMS